MCREGVKHPVPRSLRRFGNGKLGIEEGGIGWGRPPTNGRLPILSLSLSSSILQPFEESGESMSEFRGPSSFLAFFFLFSYLGACLRAISAVESDDELLVGVREEAARSAGYGEEKLSSVLVTGTVVCEACLPGEVETRAWHVPGASIGVACNSSGKRTRLSWSRGSTDEEGDFIIDLPSHLHAIPNLEKMCMAKIIRLPRNTLCRRASLKRLRSIRLSSVGNGIRTYTTGVMKLRRQSKTAGHACLKKRIEYEHERTW
ncbi:hypothetical protein ACLOJK_035679 [Asimina triloba]